MPGEPRFKLCEPGIRCTTRVAARPTASATRRACANMPARESSVRPSRQATARGHHGSGRISARLTVSRSTRERVFGIIQGLRTYRSAEPRARGDPQDCHQEAAANPAQSLVVLPVVRMQEPDPGNRAAAIQLGIVRPRSFGLGSWPGWGHGAAALDARARHRPPGRIAALPVPACPPACPGVRRFQRTRERRPKDPHGRRSPRWPGGGSADKSPPGALASECS